MTRFDLASRLRMLDNQLRAGEIDAQQHRLLRKAAALAYSEGRQLRRRARRAVQSALERGELVRPERCEACGATGGPLDAHHWNGYEGSAMLQVQFLDERCHALADRLPQGVRLQPAQLPAEASA